MPPRLLQHAAAGLLLLAAAPLLRADVFWRIPRKTDTLIQQLGGTRLYATDVRLNGAPGKLSAYACAASASQTGADLSRQFGLPPAKPFTAPFITHAEKNRLYRFLVLPSAADAESCLVLTFEQSLRDAAAPSPPSWPDGTPALNATPTFTAVCALTRTTFVTAETAAAPEAALQEAAALLTQAGWAPARPSAPALICFTQGRKQCALFASAHPKTGQTSISLLQREGATP